jgi:hypothetical protein
MYDYLAKKKHPFVDKGTLYIYTCKCIFMHTGARPRAALWLW